MIPDEILTYKVEEARACQKTVSGPRWLWRWVRRLYLWRYGVRGAIKPPLGPMRGQRKTLRYCWRYFFWKLESRIYLKTGIPDEWFANVRVAPLVPEHIRRESLRKLCGANLGPPNTRLGHTEK